MELNVEILNGDCIAVMDELIKKGKKFTHIITSPPITVLDGLIVNII